MDKEDRERLIKLQSDVEHMKETLNSHIEDDKTIHRDLTKEVKGISTKITLILGGLIVISTLINLLK